ncbi:MAG: VOC family protein [Bdellovibrionaceae bacterium]|nr:VOC family protein [Pseudobdellovibrionaceae bacterium]NUM60365.1 VOC family protein [Pseudobdellovibrionaceae bacterium]
MNHIALRVSSLENYKKFLKEVFDYQETETIESEEGRFTICFMDKNKSGSIELIKNWDEIFITKGRNLSHFGFTVENYNEFKKKIIDLGYAILEENTKPSGLLQLYISDPDGTPIEVNEARQ